MAEGAARGPAGFLSAFSTPFRWIPALVPAAAIELPTILRLRVPFALADAPEERLRDLDASRANMPFTHEETLLRLPAHPTAVLIASGLIRNRVRTDGLDAWLRRGPRCLGAGCVLDPVPDAAKADRGGGPPDRPPRTGSSRT